MVCPSFKDRSFLANSRAVKLNCYLGKASAAAASCTLSIKVALKSARQALKSKASLPSAPKPRSGEPTVTEAKADEGMTLTVHLDIIT